MVQNPSSAANPTVFKPTELPSLQQVAGTYEFQFLLPTNIPAGSQLQKIPLFRIGQQSDMLQIRYVRADGHYLRIKQGAGFAGFSTIWPYAPDSHKGKATVQGNEAFWMEGNLRATAPPTDPRNPNLVWQPGPLALTWHSGPHPNGRTNAFLDYTLESDNLTLAQLLAMANSVQPHH